MSINKKFTTVNIECPVCNGIGIHASLMVVDPEHFKNRSFKIIFDEYREFITRCDVCNGNKMLTEEEYVMQKLSGKIK